MNACCSSQMLNGTDVFRNRRIMCRLKNQNPFYNTVSQNAAKTMWKYSPFRAVHMLPGLRLVQVENHLFKIKKTSGKVKTCAALNAAEYRKMKAESQVKLPDDEEDEDLCPVDCVKEFRTDAELEETLETAKKTGSLVVVDFYRTACGSCKYIEQGFVKLCKGAGDEDASVIFLKHNVMDEYEEQSDVAERLKIKVI